MAEQMESKSMILAEGLVKIYKTKITEVLALQGLDLQVSEGELTAIIGNSGSGKSTFLNMIGGLDRPSAGTLFVDGKNLFTMSEKELVEYKQKTVGFVSAKKPLTPKTRVSLLFKRTLQITSKIRLIISRKRRSMENNKN